jgi:hypothetical protein
MAAVCGDPRGESRGQGKDYDPSASATALVLAQRLRDWMAGDESRLLTTMGAGMATNVKARLDEARAADSDTDLVAYLTFSEIVRLGGKIAAVRQSLGYASRERWREVQALNELRNAVMHPTRDLVGRDCSLSVLADRDRLLRALLNRLDEKSQAAGPDA